MDKSSTSPSVDYNPDSIASAGRQGDRKRTRAAVACTRCRRLRKKCIHHQGQIPCNGCREAGMDSECRLPARGDDSDRNFRRATVKKHVEATTPQAQQITQAQGTSVFSLSETRTSMRSLSVSSIENRWDLLPPLNEVIEGCKTFGSSFFQLGFLPKAIFLEQLTNNPTSVNVFFLLGILSISARFTPSLIARFGDGLKAADVFMERAATLVIEEMYTPTLERIQAFFLLAISEWGKGDKTSSNIHMGIAVRMAGMLRLHREESYELRPGFTADDVINAEMARRTFWMLESQDNLHSGYTTPVSFSLLDVTTLLPCDERDFAFGLIPHERAALAGTLAAIRNPSIVHSNSRSLFASLIQAHNLWGQVARGAVTSSIGDLEAWKPSSDYNRLRESLASFEEHLPNPHKWSIWNFRGYKAEGLDLAYLSVVMVIRLSQIILRRRFIDNIIGKENDGAAPQDFWLNMSSELFSNVLELHEQIDAFFSLRAPDQGFPAMIVFCVYVCGSLANHLWKRPEICPELASGMQEIVHKSLKILSELQHPWQLATKWKVALEQRAAHAQPDAHQRNSSEVSRSTQSSERGSGEENAEGCILSHQVQATTAHHTVRPDSHFDQHTEVSFARNFDWIQHPVTSAETFGAFTPPEDDLEAQLIEFLQVQGQLGLLFDGN